MKFGFSFSTLSYSKTASALSSNFQPLKFLKQDQAEGIPKEEV